MRSSSFLRIRDRIIPTSPRPTAATRRSLPSRARRSRPGPSSKRPSGWRSRTCGSSAAPYRSGRRCVTCVSAPPASSHDARHDTSAGSAGRPGMQFVAAVRGKWPRRARRAPAHVVHRRPPAVRSDLMPSSAPAHFRNLVVRRRPGHTPLERFKRCWPSRATRAFPAVAADFIQPFRADGAQWAPAVAMSRCCHPGGAGRLRPLRPCRSVRSRVVCAIASSPRAPLR